MASVGLAGGGLQLFSVVFDWSRKVSIYEFLSHYVSTLLGLARERADSHWGFLSVLIGAFSLLASLVSSQGHRNQKENPGNPQPSHSLDHKIPSQSAFLFLTFKTLLIMFVLYIMSKVFGCT